jgi:DNA-binding NarL/FixJ family response regulator
MNRIETIAPLGVLGESKGTYAITLARSQEEPQRTTKIILVGENVLLRSSLRLLLNTLFSELYVFETSNCQGVASILDQHPDLSLIAVDHSNGWNSSSLRDLPNFPRRPPLILICADEHPCSIATMLRDGVKGIIPRSLTCEVMVTALELVLAGGVFLPSTLVEPHELYQASLNEGGHEDGDAAGPSSPCLTNRQREVLLLAAEGFSNKMIAQRLARSPATIKNHMAAIIMALGARNRVDAVRIAVKRRLISP